MPIASRSLIVEVRQVTNDSGRTFDELYLLHMLILFVCRLPLYFIVARARARACVCVCVCVCERERERERERESQRQS